MSSPWSQPFATDIEVFNRWLCVSRIRASVLAGLFFSAVSAGGLATLDAEAVIITCAALAVFSFVALRSPGFDAHPTLFFWLQLATDIAAITLGIGFAAHGEEALLARPLYVIVIVPASLLSVPFGLAAAGLSSLGHVILLGLERGWSPALFTSFDVLAPTFLFFMVAQQCFVYGAHMRAKGEALTALAHRLEESQGRLAEEGRLAAGIAEMARTLSESLDDPEPMARVACSIRERLSADWCAMFAIDDGTFRLLAADGSGPTWTGRDALDLPLAGWPALEQLETARVLALSESELGTLPASLSGLPLRSTLLAGLFRDHAMIGFVAVGHVSPLGVAESWARSLLTGIAEHASVVFQNANLLDEVRAASALKSEFVGAVSHELRSPLNILLGYLEMLLDEALGPLTSEQRDALRRMNLQASTLLEMIEALLDLNRIEAGRLPVESVEVALPALLLDVCEPMQRTLARPGVALHCDVAPDAVTLRTDPSKLKTVVRNLVHNALKFTEHGEVRVTARREDGGLAIAVADTGCGIPREALGYVFESFRQVPGSSGGGVGLGLHIVRRLADALGARITVESTPGQGSLFRVLLPDTTNGLAKEVDTRAA